MADIKTKDVLKGSIKALDKGATAAERIKTATVSTKDKAEQSVAPRESSPEEYAQNRMSDAGERLGKEGVHQFHKRGKQGVAETKDNIGKAKEYFQNRRSAHCEQTAGGSAPTPQANTPSSARRAMPDSITKPPNSSPQRYHVSHSAQEKMIQPASPQERAKKLAVKNIRDTASQAKNTAKGGDGIYRSTHRAGKSIKTAGKSTMKATGKGTIKTAGRSVKTAQYTSKTTIKTAQHTAKAANTTAKAAAKTAQLSARAAKAAAKTAVTTMKAAFKATLAAIKALLMATKALIAAIAAGGWIVVVVLLLICLVAFLVASPFGMFFSGDAEGGTSPIRQVVADTSNEFSREVIAIVNGNPHDEMRMTVTNRGYLRADNWIDVLAIFAISTATQDGGGTDVVTIDAAKSALIRDIFWEMVGIQHHMESESHEEPVLDDDGNETGDTITVTTQILILEISFKGAAEIADIKGFTRQQKEILTEMLGGDYDDMFKELIGNIGLISMAGDGSGAVGTGDFIWPVPASDYVTSPFGSRVDPFTGVFSTHLGIDISGGAGTPIVASDGGTVVSTSVDGTYGVHALIDHGNGSSTLYAHMSSISVGVGDSVDQGQQIGGMGETGRARGVHLHFEVWQGGGRVEPLQFFDNYTTAW